MNLIAGNRLKPVVKEAQQRAYTYSDQTSVRARQNTGNGRKAKPMSRLLKMNGLPRFKTRDS